ncbi:MAG TPA: formyltetrahydrofolate deformylase [Acidimicrobiales bacterium]|nr:formyltetrahydrofolate deformylase [Acidimicrobiales bacterium]
MVASEASEIIVTLSCPDRVGIVHAVAGFMAERGINMVESKQFSDLSSDRFFMRVQAAPPPGTSVETLLTEIVPLAEAFSMTVGISDAAARPSMLILVSRQGHCLNDLLYRCRVGALRADIAAVVSNHEDMGDLVRSYGISFHHLPVTPETKEAQEARLRSLVDELGIDLVVLARYMQILSAPTVEHLAGRAINIHHSFLPSFRGAEPYRQAYERGVKLIGATAHYVTAELDEGPIIEQEVARVDHAMSPKELAAVSRDIECVTLARAVAWHLEHRVMLNGGRTVVFR